MSDWQSIDTAPQDDRMILIWGGVITTDISRPEPNDEIQLVRRVGDGKYMVTGGAYYSCWVTDPTHWAPVPNPPGAAE